MDENECTEEEKKEKPKSIVLEVQSLRHVMKSTIIKPQPAQKKENENNG